MRKLLPIALILFCLSAIYGIVQAQSPNGGYTSPGFGSGVSSLNGLKGALSLTSTGSTITITPSGSTIDLETSTSTPVTCAQLPALTGDTTTTAGSCATTTAKINGTSFAGTSGHLVSFGAANTPADSGIVATAVTQTIASGTAAMGTGAITSGTCATVVTVSATGVATTDNIQYNPNADPTGVTGYAVSATGSLYIWAYPTSGNVNFKVCNNTAGSLTPGALTLNWRVVR